MLNQSIGFIGAGQMARALAQGFVNANLTEAARISYCDPVENACDEFAVVVEGACRAASNFEVVQQSDITFLAVKPQSMSAVYAEVGGRIPSDKLIVSIAAGITLARLCEGLKTNRVIRVMPN